MPLTYVPKVFLKFKLPDGSTREGFLRQSEVLRDIITRFGVEGAASLSTGRFGRRRKLNQDKNIGQLKLKNDDTIVLKRKA
jgi:hypothetical protein